MTTQPDDAATPRSYALDCIHCEFEMTVEGDVFDVLDAIDDHQGEHTNDAFEHFVEFENRNGR